MAALNIFPGIMAYVEKNSKNRAWMGFYPTQNNQKLASEGKKYST